MYRSPIVVSYTAIGLDRKRNWRRGACTSTSSTLIASICAHVRVSSNAHNSSFARAHYRKLTTTRHAATSTTAFWWLHRTFLAILRDPTPFRFSGHSKSDANGHRRSQREYDYWHRLRLRPHGINFEFIITCAVAVGHFSVVMFTLSFGGHTMGIDTDQWLMNM